MNEPTTWLVTAFGSERQYAGNTGYADEITKWYRYDSNVPNHKKVRTGDQLVIRDRSRILGVASIASLESAESKKPLNLCPGCRRSGIKERKTRSPRYRCHGCGMEFDTPEIKEVDVTNFTAQFANSFRSCVLPLDLAIVRSACPTFNGQHAMQEIRLPSLGGYGAQLRDAAAAAAFAASNGSGSGLTADAAELDRRAHELRNRGRVPRPAGQPVPGRAQASTSVTFLRDPAVKAWILQEAEGSCEACGEPGPFVTPSGERFLEVHHLVPLAEGGTDTPENAVAVCPNCHRALHLAADRDRRREQVRERIPRARRNGADAG